MFCASWRRRGNSASRFDARLIFHRHPGEGWDLTLSVYRTGEIPAFAGMTTLTGRSFGCAQPRNRFGSIPSFAILS